MIPCPRGMLDSAGDFFYKRRLTNRRGVFRAAPRFSRPGDAQVAQLVEQRTENPRVGGSIDCESALADSCPRFARVATHR